MNYILRDFDIPEEDIVSSLKRAVEGVDGNEYNYSFELHREILKEMGYANLELFVEKMNGLLNENYIFDDTMFFLDSLKNTERKLVLLTAGSDDFQNKKIDHAGVRDYFDEIHIVRNGKDAFVQKYLEKENFIQFINDNLKENVVVKKKYPEIEVITKYNKKKNTVEECAESQIPYFYTLTEILEYVRNHK